TRSHRRTARPRARTRSAGSPRPGAMGLSLVRSWWCLPGHVVVPSWSRARRRQLTGSARDQPDRENGLATEWRAGVLDALEEPLDGDAAEPGRILIHDRDRG